MSIIPPLIGLPFPPQRIILHWTAGGPNPADHDLKAYHYVVAQWGGIFEGVPVAKNMRLLKPTDDDYAAHTRGFNSFSVGVSLCGMKGAVEGGDLGPHPITRDQTYAACQFVAECCEAWALPVSAATVFTHWEAQAIHNVPQKGKWDITVIPWLPRLGKRAAGEYLRTLVRGSKV